VVRLEEIILPKEIKGRKLIDIIDKSSQELEASYEVKRKNILDRLLYKPVQLILSFDITKNYFPTSILIPKGLDEDIIELRCTFKIKPNRSYKKVYFKDEIISTNIFSTKRLQKNKNITPKYRLIKKEICDLIKKYC
jgi:hypothetical protein